MTAKKLMQALVDQGWSQEQAELGIRAGFRCEYCDRYLLRTIEDYDAWQIDHIVPQSRGGSDGLDNKALVCKMCNFMKRDEVVEGTTREDRIRAARTIIHDKRKRKYSELLQVLDAVRQWQ